MTKGRIASDGFDAPTRSTKVSWEIADHEYAKRVLFVQVCASRIENAGGAQTRLDHRWFTQAVQALSSASGASG